MTTYFTVNSTSLLIQAIYDENPASKWLVYEGSDSQTYKAVSVWHQRDQIISQDEYDELERTTGSELYGHKYCFGYKGSIVVVSNFGRNSLHKTSNGVLYSTLYDAYIKLHPNATLNASDIIPDIKLLNVVTDNVFLDPTILSNSMCSVACDSGALTPTRLQISRQTATSPSI
jgi:hypothetical protein